MKLLNNLLVGDRYGDFLGGRCDGRQGGAGPKQVVDVINAGTGRNTASEDKFPKYVLPRTFNLGFAIGLLNKDVRLCMEEADALGVPMIVGSAVRQLLAIATASEGQEADMTDLLKPVERWAGVTVGSKNT